MKSWLGKWPYELRKDTIRRFDRAITIGYRVFYVWESDLRDGSFVIKEYHGDRVPTILTE